MYFVICVDADLFFLAPYWYQSLSPTNLIRVGNLLNNQFMTHTNATLTPNVLKYLAVPLQLFSPLWQADANDEDKMTALFIPSVKSVIGKNISVVAEVAASEV